MSSRFPKTWPVEVVKWGGWFLADEACSSASILSNAVIFDLMKVSSLLSGGNSVDDPTDVSQASRVTLSRQLATWCTNRQFSMSLQHPMHWAFSESWWLKWWALWASQHCGTWSVAGWVVCWAAPGLVRVYLSTCCWVPPSMLGMMNPWSGRCGRALWALHQSSVVDDEWRKSSEYAGHWL